MTLLERSNAPTFLRFAGYWPQTRWMIAGPAL